MPRFQDEFLQNALRDMNSFQNSPAHRALMEHHDRMQKNPAYRAAMEDAERRQRDFAYRTLMENVERINSNPAYRALLQFEDNRSKYLSVSKLPPHVLADQNLPSHIRDLQRDLLKNNTEFWLKRDVLESASKFQNYEKGVIPTREITPIRSVKAEKIQPAEDTPKPPSAAAQTVERINEDYIAAANELAADERLVMFAVLGGKEYRVKSIVAEETTDRVKVFIDSKQGGMFVYSDPANITIMYGKEKVPSGKSKRRVDFLSYKRGVGNKDEIKIFSNRTKNIKMTQVSIIRIVVASPNDVMTERKALEEVVSEINQGIARNLGFRLELTKWETDAYPGFHPEGPQGLIDPILNIEDSNIFIGIFWKRFGTPTMNAGSGTEYEFSKAYESWKSQGTPHIMFYFKEKDYFPKSKEEIEQMSKVIEFKKNFPAEALFWDYEDESEFEKLLRKHLTNLLLDYYQSDENDEEETEEEDDFTDEDDDENEEQEEEPKTLHDERIVIKAHSMEPYDFMLSGGDTLIVDIESNEPITIAVIDTDNCDAWANNEEVETYECYENRKRVLFNFEPGEDGEYSVVISNNAFLAEADVDVEISYLG